MYSMLKNSKNSTVGNSDIFKLFMCNGKQKYFSGVRDVVIVKGIHTNKCGLWVTHQIPFHFEVHLLAQLQQFSQTLDRHVW